LQPLNYSTMKTLKYLHLALFLVLGLHAQEPSLVNSEQLATKLDATNAAVNAAIEEDAAASRASLGLGTAATADNGIYSPAFAARLLKMATTSNVQATVLYLGDSMGWRIPARLYKHLENQYPIAGYALDSLKTLVASGTVVAPGINATPNYQPTMVDSGAVWNMSSGSVINVGAPLGGASYQELRCSKIIVWCAKQTSGGSIAVDFQRDGSTWVALGTLATAGTAGEVARAEFELPATYFAKFRITASGGSVNYIGAKVWAAGSTGLILAGSANGGIQIGQANQASAAIRNQIGADLGGGLILSYFGETTDQVDQAKVNTYVDNWRTAMPDSDLLMFEQIQNTGYEDDAVYVNNLHKIAASSRPWMNVIPTEDLLRGMGYITEADYEYNSSGVFDGHLDDEAWMAVAGKIYTEVFGGWVPAMNLTLGARTGNTQDWQYGNMPTDAAFRRYLFPVDRAEGGRIGLVTRQSFGNESGIFLTYYGTEAGAFNHGGYLSQQTDSGTFVPVAFDGSGCTTIGHGSTPQSANTAGGRCYIREDSASRSALVVQHISATATDIVKVKNSDGADIFKIHRTNGATAAAYNTPSAYADDAAAATAGVPVGGIYRVTGGTVAWRQE
jgi:hypothetical protein